jgi:hypothetical protein
MANTTNYSWSLPTVGGNQDAWGDLLNANWTALDTLLGGTNATEFAILDGATITTAELNVLDGVTATTAEINVLDGITATVTELNYTDGVTSNIQTQLDALSSGKQSVDATLTAYAGTLTAANKIPYATATDTAGELDFKDEDNMASNSATAVPSQQSVKAYVDAQSYTQPTTLGAVGAYGFLVANQDVAAGATITGDNLNYSNAYGDAQGASPGASTTWRCMGSALATTAGEQRATLFLRIS